MNAPSIAISAVATQNEPRMNGLFITFEGIDGAGKSSHVPMLADAFAAQGREVLLTREPGGTELAESLRQMVLTQAMDAVSETLLVFAARRDHLMQRIEPALARGAVVVCDRFTDATFAYQGGGRGVDMTMLDSLEHWVQQGRQPDLTLWFDLPPAIAAQRRGAARAPDRFEAMDETFFARVRDVYAARAAAAPRRFARVDAQRTPAEVREAIVDIVAARGLW